MIRLSVNFPFRKKCVSAGLRGGGGEIVRRQRLTDDTDEFPCLGRKPLRGAFIRSLGANAIHRGHNGRHRQVFAFGMKTVHGRRRRQMAAVSTSFRVWDESRSERRSEDECGPFVPVGGRQALRSTRIQTETIRRSSRDPKRAVVVLPLPLGG